MWFLFALLSALFAALTSILAKVGIEGVNSNLATAVRTVVVVAMAWGMVFLTDAQGGIADISSALWDFNNMPSMIYEKWFRRIGTYILPVFVITNFPGLFLMGELSPWACVWGAAAPVLFFALSRALWKFSLKKYSSASS